MNWSRWRSIPWIDTRAAFVAATPKAGNLLDLGTSNGETLCHMWELRPDLNYFDDSTHVAPVPVETMGRAARDCGLEPAESGKSRNWLFAATYPLFFLLPARRGRYVAKLHWLGWSVYLIAQKPLAQ